VQVLGVELVRPPKQKVARPPVMGLVMELDLELVWVPLMELARRLVAGVLTMRMAMAMAMAVPVPVTTLKHRRAGGAGGCSPRTIPATG
jgi:hypothetical protein